MQEGRIFHDSASLSDANAVERMYVLLSFPEL